MAWCKKGIVTKNNILIMKNENYIFKSSFWIYYFAAKRMHINVEFTKYIFESKIYISSPEIIEFYTGIDRNRDDALKLLTNDMSLTRSLVEAKVGLPNDMDIFSHIKWRPSEDQIEKVQSELSENVINSTLPDSIKDQHSDRNYNQIAPYNQNIQTFLEEYSLYNLIQNVRACSRALRNSDYVEPNIKKLMFKEILNSWHQISNVLLAITPIIASIGEAEFAGYRFILGKGFGDNIDEKINRIIQANPTNVVGLFKDDLFSNKLGPLFYEQFSNESNPLVKHHIALLIIFTRPRGWKKQIEDYIVSISKDSFYLFDTVNALRARYKYDFADSSELRDISYLIKMGLAKHEFGHKRPRLDKISKITNKNLPKREFDE